MGSTTLTQLKSAEAAARWLREWCGGTLRSDSRQVRPGDAFIAWPGHSRDGRSFVDAALAAGAATCLVEAQGVEAFGFTDARIATLPGLKAATGLLAAQFHGDPSQQMAVVASTGTNGKTSTAWWTAQALGLLGQRCGVVGTLGIGEPPASIEHTGLTTPDPVQLQQAFAEMAAGGYRACAIEASSIGLVEQRLAGTAIRVALFTNFTQDHLDFHGDMAAYWTAKRALFDWPGLQAAVINLDDPKGRELVVELNGRLAVWTYSVGGAARLSAQDLHYGPEGLAFTLCEQGTDSEQRRVLQTGLIGDYNIANLLAVIGGLRALGHGLEDVARVAAQVTPVPGRMQRVGKGTELPQLVVDYAHTPDALDKALAALQPLAAARGGHLVCVFGCGGNRDRSKRPQMGAIAAQRAQRVIVTSDNPRLEAPEAILADIVAGMPAGGERLVLADRREAIVQAVLQAGTRDVVLIAGKGHEDYQEIDGRKLVFSDVDEARAALLTRAGL